MIWRNLLSIFPVPGDQRVCAGIPGIDALLSGDCGEKLAGLLLAQLDAPLVEGVDRPDRAFGEDDVLVQSDQLAKHRRCESRSQDRRRGAVARHDLVRNDAGIHAFRGNFVGSLSESQNLRLRG